MGRTAHLLQRQVSLAEKVHYLSEPECYTALAPTTRVDVLETHLSFVFLADQEVYKLKKPARYGYLDFSSVSARERYCREEVRLNQPLAGGTYRGVVPIVLTRGILALNGAGEVVDWLVRMNRLPAEGMLDHAIRSGAASNERIKAAASKLISFYKQSSPVYPARTHFRGRLIKDIDASAAVLLGPRSNLQHAVVLSVTANLLHYVIRHRELFDERIDTGRIIDAHGDLRPEHVWLGADPLIIDRLEFNPALRRMDIAEELAYLSMECDLLAAPGVGQLFLNVYRMKTDDRPAEQLILFYKAKRALLRARLSINHLQDPAYRKNARKWTDRAEQYVCAAEKYADQLS